MTTRATSRARSFGAILRSTWRLYSGHWLFLVCLSALILLPAAVLDFLVGRSAPPGEHVFMNIVFGKFAFPGSAAIMFNMNPSSSSFLADQFDSLIIALSLPIAAGGIVHATATWLGGSGLRLRDALNAALGRWLDFVQIGILWFVCPFLLWNILNVMPPIVGPLRHFASATLIVCIVVVTILLMLAFIATVAAADVTRLDPVRASLAGLSLVFRRAHLWQSLKFGLALGIIYAALSLIIAIAAAVWPAMHIVLNLAHEVMVMIFYPFAVIAVSLYVFDASAREATN